MNWNLFKRPAAGGILAGATTAQQYEPSLKVGEGLQNLTHDRVRNDFRWAMNRGDFVIPTWALDQAIQVSPLLQQGILKWRASIGGLDWTIRKQKTHPQAEAHAAALQLAYDRADTRGTVLALCMARFSGYAVGTRQPGGRLSWLDPWNVARDYRYGEWYWNPLCRATRARDLGQDNIIDPATAIIRRHEYPLLLTCLWFFLEADGVHGWWNENLKQESKRQVIVIPGQGVAGLAGWEETAKDAAAGKSGWLNPGNGEGQPTNVLFPPASRGLTLYGERAKWLEVAFYTVLFGESLSTQTQSGSGTLAGGAHQISKDTIIASEAAEISRTLQEQFDVRILQEAGLLQPGQAPGAYFELSTKREADVGTEIEQTAKLAVAGWQRDGAELSERTGYKLTAAPKVAPPALNAAADSFMNRLEASIQDLRTEEVARETLANFDESQHPRDDDGKFGQGAGSSSTGDAKEKSIVSGNITAEKQKQIADEANAIIQRDSSYSDFGFRMLPDDMDNVKVGDKLEKSFRWEDGTNSGDNIEGVSTIGIRGDAGKAMRYFAPAPSEGYFGRKVALVRGVRNGSGQDAGETIMDNAEVVGIWDVGR